MLGSNQERCTQDWCSQSMSAKAVGNQMVPQCAGRWGEMDNRADTPFGCCPSTVNWIEQCFTSPPTQYRLYGRRVQAQCFSLLGNTVWMPNETDAKKIGTAFPLENWRRPPGRPHIKVPRHSSTSVGHMAQNPGQHQWLTVTDSSEQTTNDYFLCARTSIYINTVWVKKIRPPPLRLWHFSFFSQTVENL